MTEHSFQGIHSSSRKRRKCNPCVRYDLLPMCRVAHPCHQALTATSAGSGLGALKIMTFGRDNLIFAVAAGHGISRYVQDTSGLGIDAEPASGVTAHLVATPAVGVEAAYQHYWFKRLRSSAICSYAAVNNTDLATPTTHNHATYVGTNLTLNPGGSLNVRAEFLYGWTMLQNGQSADAPRIQFSAKYSFVKLDPD
jgi:hypothetical protein